MPEAPSLEDQPIDDAVEAPENSDQPNGEQEPASFADFDYSGIPDDQREEVEKRIKGFQGSYTQAMQGVSETRKEAEQAQQIIAALQNPETAPKVLEAFGFELPQDEAPEDEPLLDPVEQMQRELAQTRGELEAFRGEQHTAAQQAAEQEQFVTQVEALEKSEGREFDAEEIQLLNKVAQRDAMGNLDVKGAFDLLSGVYSARQKDWVASKKAPRNPSSGTPGSKAADLSNPAEFREFTANLAQEALASAE